METDLVYNNLTLPLEMKLLLLCMFKNISDKQQKEIEELLAFPIDWDYFLNMAIKNKVYPYVYRNLKKIDAGGISEQILIKLQALCKENNFHSLLHARELSRIMDVIKANEIQAIPLKGPLLSMSIYQDISIRVSRDIDILADPFELEAIHQLLLKEGYTRYDILPNLSPKQEKNSLKKFHHWLYTNKEDVQLELHWKMSDVYFDIPFQDIWDNRTEVILFGRSFPVLKEEDNLLYLITHGSSHAWKRLQWLYDIYEMINSKSLDWDYIKLRAKQRNIMHLLGQTMLLLKVLFQYSIPNQLNLSKKEWKLANSLVNQSLPFILSLENEAEIVGHSLYPQYKKYMLVWNRGIYKKLQFVALISKPNSVDYQSIKLPDQLFFLYYFVHLIQELKKFVLFAKKNNHK